MPWEAGAPDPGVIRETAPVLAADHDRIAARFTEVVDAVTDWDAPTPVPEWRARDVVGHLTTWLPGYLAGLGTPPPYTSAPSRESAHLATSA